ncbi:Nif3-like dinuclear metal center hexameric protein [Sedimentibacter sp. zth1]|uniref:Nif3-like dinuclear metal center hexameric protein n=1 Tax=Sedimentibacter sp. zth1 TaxID=2816908 RepID=UPI001A91F84C|nr:Nif3-like dinuclear metal center hexameric protein [Sedimentibacter sp. zth1]QSX06828.1 Nif3-like dinuclear metal center hexameric protein [Sedimentibacter sp. zth1]
MNVKDVENYLNNELMLQEQEKWDNSGLQIGNYNQSVSGILLTLDITEECVDKCIESNCNLIISHHPLIFTSLKNIDVSTCNGRIIQKLLKYDISAYSMHTSLDLALNGVNESLADALGLKRTSNLIDINKNCANKIGYGGIAKIESINIIEYAEIVKEKLMCKNVELYCNNVEKKISTIAFCGGSGANFIQNAILNNADVYITGDIKYHDAQFALNNNLAIIDAGHYNTERVVLDKLYEILFKKIKNIQVYDKNFVNKVIL